MSWALFDMLVRRIILYADSNRPCLRVGRPCLFMMLRAGDVGVTVPGGEWLAGGGGGG